VNLKKREVGDLVIVDIEGKLVGGPDESPEFHDFFKSLLGGGANEIVINLRNTPWASSLGIGMLIGAHTSVANAGGELVLAHVSDRINDLLNVTRLYLVFKCFGTDEAAIKYLTEKG